MECSRLFGEVATQFARGEMPEEILRGIKMGRMTALQKRDGGVRGIVVGDVVRRLVARTITQQFTEEAEAVTHPFQYALSTRAGTECVAHVVQSLASMDSNATILSIDGVGAYDFISRRAMFQGVADLPTVTNLSYSSGNFTRSLPLSCGKISWEKYTRSAKVKGENKETP